MTRNHRIRFMDLPRAQAGNSTGATADVSFPYTNAYTTIRSEVWKWDVKSQVILWDFGSAQQITFLGIVGPLDEVFSLSPEASITLEANNLNDFTNPPLSRMISATDRGVFEFLDDLEDTRYRYWRLSIEDSRNPGDIVIGHLYLGDHRSIEQRNVLAGFNVSRVDSSVAAKSESGVEYFAVQPSYLQYSGIGVNFLEEADRKGLERLTYKYSIHTPLFVSLDPTLQCSSELSEMTRFMRFTSPMQVEHVKHKTYSVKFDLTEVF